MTGLRELRLVVPGRPVQWARATGGRTVRHFTPAAQRTYAQRIQAEWIAAGRPRLEDGPIVLVCRFILARPKKVFHNDRRRLQQRIAQASVRKARWTSAVRS